MLEQFTVENFKGFEKLTLDDLGHINIFVGKNNTGKTSLLQAIGYSSLKEESNYNLAARLIALLFGINTVSYPPAIPAFLNTINVDNGSKKTVCSFLDSNEDIKTQFEIEVNQQFFNDFNIDLKVNSISQKGNKHNKRVENFEVKQNSHVTFQFDLYHMPLFIFANHILLKHFSIYNYSQMIREGTFYKVIELLQNLDSRLKNLIPLASDDMVCDVGMSKPIPLDNMGDGFLKLFAFACLLNQKFPLVLIDEPENGLHYSAQKQFWGMLSDACLNNGKQSFIATHSYELLESLNTLLNDNPDLTKPKEEGGQGLKVRVYELQRVGEHLQVVKIDQEVMSILIKHGSDFRG